LGEAAPAHAPAHAPAARTGGTVESRYRAAALEIAAAIMERGRPVRGTDLPGIRMPGTMAFPP
jgi:hypothetical protein